MNSILLTLRGHCIETAAKERLNILIKKSILEDIDEGVIKEIEILRDFIETTDFRRLRSQYPEYDGSKEMVVRITRIGDKSYEIESISGSVLEEDR